MSYKDFVDHTIFSLDEGLFFELKDSLVDAYISFSFINRESIGIKVLAEKICDYFEKIELKTGKSFEQVVKKYTNDLDAIVSDRIAKEPKSKKNETIHKIPRARKYYEKACLIKKNNKLTQRELIDYSRIMLCLYMEIINNNLKTIDNFNFDVACLNINKIIDVIQLEKGLLGKKPRFDTKEPYSLNRSSLVIMIIIFYYIKSKEIVGEN